MLKKKNQQVLKSNIKNNIILKYEYKNIILKSIIQNKNINYKIRLFSFLSIKKGTIKKNKKICLISGRHRGVNTNLNISRHNVNYFAKLGILQNFQLNSW